jgi:hypothetical protein
MSGYTVANHVFVLNSNRLRIKMIIKKVESDERLPRFPRIDGLINGRSCGRSAFST